MPERSEARQPAVLITGASTGIGMECALGLVHRGFHVFAGVRKETDGERLREQAPEGELTPVMIDVTDADSIRAAVDEISQSVGEAGLAGLVNNAGIGVLGPIELVPIERLRLQFEVNLIGHVAVTQAFLPLLRAAKGRIVNMGSITGRVPVPYLGAYSMTKHALEALTDLLRVELRRQGVSVTIVQPDYVKTPIWDKSLNEFDRVIEEMSPEEKDRYEADVTAMRAVTDRYNRKGMPVKRVVRAVLHAMCARRPRTRYPVGIRTIPLSWAAMNAPNRVFDRGLCCTLRLK